MPGAGKVPGNLFVTVSFTGHAYDRLFHLPGTRQRSELANGYANDPGWRAANQGTDNCQRVNIRVPSRNGLFQPREYSMLAES